jgi:hypothetical protein
MAIETENARDMPAFFNCKPGNRIQGVPGRNMISAQETLN